MNLSNSISFSWDPAGAGLAPPPSLASVPATPGVYRIVPLRGESHISWSSNLQRRLKRLHATLGNGLQRVDCWPAWSKLDTALLLYQLTKVEFPNNYKRRLRLRTPWFLSLSEADPYPQLVITQRLGEGTALALGPFGSRDAAQVYQESTLGLFQVRRCPGLLEPAPEHPGCLYGEIGQCLRPCQCAVSRQEYLTEVDRVAEFLASDGRSLLSNLSLARGRASEAMDFEAAAQAHKRLEKVKAAVALRETAVGNARRFSGLALTKSQQPNACQLRPMFDGCWQDALTFTFEPNAPASRSIDADIRERLSAAATIADQSGDRNDHLAIFSRWFRSSWCDGDWFPFQNLGDVDYRKLVRKMSKLVQSPTSVVGSP